MSLFITLNNDVDHYKIYLKNVANCQCQCLNFTQNIAFLKLILIFQHQGGISSFRVLSLTDFGEFEVVWALEGYSHDSNEYWDLGQARIRGNEVIIYKYYYQ